MVPGPKVLGIVEAQSARWTQTERGQGGKDPVLCAFAEVSSKEAGTESQAGATARLRHQGRDHRRSQVTSRADGRRLWPKPRSQPWGQREAG